jgi:hypothetical protein
MDYRSCSVGPDYLFRGGLGSQLIEIKVLFERRNLKFEIKDEDMQLKKGNNAHIIHRVSINDTNYLIADGEYDRGDGPLHYLMQVENIIKHQLKLQGSKENVYKIVSYYGESMWYLIIEEKHFKIFEKHKDSFSESQLLNDNPASKTVSPSAFGMLKSLFGKFLGK